jgi:glutamyl-tRNA synthetase
MLNYLARLGWSHGDDEVFSMEQLTEWFDLDHLTNVGGAVQSGKTGLAEQPLYQAGRQRAPGRPGPSAHGARGRRVDGAPPLPAVLALMKERTNTVNELADAAMLFYRTPQPDAALAGPAPDRRRAPALAQFADRCKRWSGARKRCPR